MTNTLKLLTLIFAAILIVCFFMNILADLPPDWIFLLVMLTGGIGFVTILFEWKQKERAQHRAEEEFREKHPPVSVTRFPVKRN